MGAVSRDVPGALPAKAAGMAASPAKAVIAVFGATSGIARAVAEAWMARGEDLVLIGRSEADLEALARDLEVVGGRRPAVFAWDIADFASHSRRFAALAAAHDLKGLLMAAGVLHEAGACEASPEKTIETFNVNLAGPAVVASLFAFHLKGKGGGFVSCLTSVAGDRGRASNYPYGASKAGLSAYLEGLRSRLYERGAGGRVLIQDVKPGPVRTRMTAHLRGPLMAEPARVARDIVRAVDAGREVVYTPGYWRPIMAVIRAIPSPLFKRLKL